MPTSVINEILSFCPQGTIASGDIMALEDYKNDVQRLRGHQPGIARRELENMALRQSSFVAAGLAQFVAKRYAPGVRDDADLDALETAITAAITALIAASNAQTATRLATKRTIGGVAFDGSANIHHYATCSTAAATAAKTVALAGFALATGARVLVKFTVTNNAANPTLDVNGTGAKPIQYRGAAIAAGTLAANRTYGFVYTGAQYELVGDVDTNTTYPLATASNDGLMAKGDKGKLDGIAVGAEVNQNAFGNILVGSTTIAADTKTDTLTFVAGTNVTLTPDAANDKLTIAANLGKWRPNAANPTGLYVPKLSDQFFRAWTGTGKAGSWQADTGRELTGDQTFTAAAEGWLATGSGAFGASTLDFATMAITGGTLSQTSAYNFRASRVWGNHSGVEFAPVHIWQPCIIYLGNSA